MFKRIVDIAFYLSLLFFIIAFNFQDNRMNGWYQQFMTNLNGRTISDITFTDSLTGYAVTPYVSMNDSTFILKTTSGGDNWFFALKQPGSAGGFRQIQFINVNTGFVCGNFLKKTTNSGINWNLVNTSGIFPENIFVISNDTIWLSDTDPLVGGMFRTTNGGLNWTKLTNGVIQPYPDKLYFFNSRIGFASNGSHLYKTTDSGFNWILMGTNTGFFDMKFTDSLTGYKAYDSLKKTTDGGINWQTQIIPKIPGVNYSNDRVFYLSVIGRDTLFGVGGYYWTPSSGYKGLIYKTTNGGQKWGYQIPDTSFGITQLNYIYFLNKKNGWAYNKIGKGVRTISGGDTTIYTSINNITTLISKEFILCQNFPNPFNQLSIINYQLSINCQVKLNIFDITGKLVKILINQRKYSGNYNIKFDGSNLPSGIYFYKLEVTDDKGNTFSDVKKMSLIK